jgi:hypothetical protein
VPAHQQGLPNTTFQPRPTTSESDLKPYILPILDTSSRHLPFIMAEIAAGAGIALAAEQVVSTSIQVGTAGYMIAKPTMPLKATFTMVANAEDDASQ